MRPFLGQHQNMIFRACRKIEVMVSKVSQEKITQVLFQQRIFYPFYLQVYSMLVVFPQTNF